MEIFSPIEVGGLVFRNRIIFPPMTTGYEEKDGSISGRSLRFYERIAQGGAAYIVLGDVSPVLTLSPTPRLLNDDMIPSFKRLTDAVHAQGAFIGAQVFHPDYDTKAAMELFREGRMQELGAKIHGDMETFASDVSVEALAEIREAMVACAVRAVKAGFDVIQVHGDRLLGMLASPIMNKRSDEYGGSLQNRARFPLEVVRGIRAACPGTPIEYKLSMIRTDPARGKGGPTIEEGAIMAGWLVEAGVDMFHAAQANHTNVGDTLPAMGVQPYACFADMAAAVKAAVDVPVSAVGRIITPEMAEGILHSGMADLVALGRPLLADPDWPRRAQEGGRIRQCIMCNKGCTDKITSRQAVGCVLNAQNGHEGEWEIAPAGTAKKVAVVGGGPAGLEAARVAALRGHDVTLYEKADQLGGQLVIAAAPPRKGEINRAVDYLVGAAREAGATLRPGCEATAQSLAAEKPDVVLLAVGANNATLPLPGADAPHVLSAWDILAGTAHSTTSSVVIGGGLVGAETAEYLAERGVDVAVVEMADSIAAEESSSIRPLLLENLQKNGAKLYPKHMVQRIEKDAVICEHEGKEVRLPCTSVVLAVGAKPQAFPEDGLAGIEVVKIGDCHNPSDIENAIETAYLAANGI